MAPLNRNRFVDILTSVILIVFFDAAHASFCDTFLAQFPSRCPKVSTVESLDLNKFTGAWFEVGSSALRKFSVGSGLSCNSAHFSTLGAATDGNNVAGFINRGLRTVSPFRSGSGVAHFRGNRAHLAQPAASVRGGRLQRQSARRHSDNARARGAGGGWKRRKW
ncbi:hypothetical protein CLOM_g22675 [Closterium sp. NIES-68]|nr:hypothetical protein CLOM_g22675 [Closterium sp. NIES-68]